MFKYLMLCVSLMLALPSYAAPILEGGVFDKTCNPGPYKRIVLVLPSDASQSGSMVINITGVKLSAGIDNPALITFEPTGSKSECASLIGFTNIPNLSTVSQIGTMTLTSPEWYGSEYFKIGNGLAMKLSVGDNLTSSLVPLTSANNGTVQTITTTNHNIETIGLAFQASLKVVGNVTPQTINKQIGIFRYTIRNSVTGNWAIAYAPISLNVVVTQADLRSCTLANANSEFTLLTVGKSGLDIPGTELQGGEITVGPVNCPKDVEVKVNFFDNATAATGLTDYLRTVYSDDSTPSQYALKFYPAGGGDPLKFLPRTQLQEGWGPAANATAVNFTQGPTTAPTSVQKNYVVKYIKTTNAGSDRPGPIKGIMTVQFLYY